VGDHADTTMPAEADPIAAALLSSPDITLHPVTVRARGRRLFVTEHCLERFCERIDDRTRELFPHMDLTDPLHRIAAIASLLVESRKGYIQNRCRPQIYGYESEGWFFVVEGPGALTVLTCYHSRGMFFPLEDKVS
jgi:hypothetical protein